MTAKEKICPAEGICEPEVCAYAAGYYDRLEGAINDASAVDAFTREVVSDIAEYHRICPFELSLELARLSDIIIGDFNHAFDPRVSLKRLLTDTAGDGGPVLMVDEAHNLPDRAREMFSAEISAAPFCALKKQFRKKARAVGRTAGEIEKRLLAEKTRFSGEGLPAAEAVPPGGLEKPLGRFIVAVEKWLTADPPADPLRQTVLTAYFQARWFVNILAAFGESHATVYSEPDGDFTVKLFCVDPAGGLLETLQDLRSAVFFSATLRPLFYFKRLCGCEPADPEIRLPSPFPKENLRVHLAGNISTRYRDRAKTRDQVAACLLHFARAHPGGHLFFFPSYEYLEAVLAAFAPRAEPMIIHRQTREMTEGDRADFLAEFSGPEGGTRVGFVVMGGVFGEGIDLAGDRLTGAAIVGVGLPGISIERELIRAFFADQFGNGYDFAYVYPGMIRVLQAAGRVIRSETDRGSILLIDDRFTRPPYSRLLPAHWRPLRPPPVADAAKPLDTGVHLR
jgi:DNA excision repair protein ERCC-2